MVAPVLALGQDTVTLSDGQDWAVPVQVSRAPDRLEVGGAPAGLSAVVRGGELRLRATGAAPGTYPLTLTGVWGSEQRRATVQVTVLASALAAPVPPTPGLPTPVPPTPPVLPPPVLPAPPSAPTPPTLTPDFSLSLGRSALSLVSGQSGSLPVGVTPNAALTGEIKLSVTAAPADLRVSLSGHTLLLDAVQTPAGSYAVTVTGTVTGAATGRLTRQVTLQVSVFPAAAQVSGVTLRASRLSLEAGQSLDLQAAVQGSGAFQPGVTWEVQSDVPALGAQLSLRSDSSASLSVPARAPSGSLSVTARSVHDPSRFAQVRVTVQAPPPLPPTAPPPTAPPTPAPPTSSGYVWYPASDRAASADELEILRLTNEARTRGATCGAASYAPAPALRWNDLLAHAARNHTLDMGKRGYFDHDTPEGVRSSDRITGAGYVWRTAGENIAAGHPSAAAVVEGWLGSPGHCANLMNPAYTDLGVGAVQVTGSAYGLYWGQNFGAPR